MNLHNEIMNIHCNPFCAKHSASYKIGHRDARHAAAELALKADAEIDRLMSSIESIADKLASDRYYKRPDAIEDLRAILSLYNNTE